MKVAITGKGGVGKTTLSSTLARLYADEGRTVLPTSTLTPIWVWRSVSRKKRSTPSSLSPK